MSPVEILGIPLVRERYEACVPFPAPGAPRKMTTEIEFIFSKIRLTPPSADSSLFHKALVMPHDQLTFDLLQSIHSDTYNDQKRCAAKIKRHVQTACNPLR